MLNLLIRFLLSITLYDYINRKMDVAPSQLTELRMVKWQAKLYTNGIQELHFGHCMYDYSNPYWEIKPHKNDPSICE